MHLSTAQIRGLAKFFTNGQIVMLFDSTTEAVQGAFDEANPRPTPNMERLPGEIERLALLDRALVEIQDGLNATGLKLQAITRPSLSVHLAKRCDELNLSVRAGNCLQNCGIEFVWQVALKTEAELLKTKNFGRRSLNEIKFVISDLDPNITIGMAHDHPSIIAARQMTERPLS